MGSGYYLHEKFETAIEVLFSHRITLFEQVTVSKFIRMLLICLMIVKAILMHTV